MSMSHKPFRRKVSKCTGRRWNFLIILLLTAILLLCCGIGLQAVQMDLSEQIYFCVGHDGQTDRISLWEAQGDDGEPSSSYYLFLPSYADLSDVTIETVNHKAVSIGEQTLQSGQKLSGLTEQKTYSLRYGRAAGAFTIIRSADTASVFIDTKDDSLDKLNADKANTAKVNVDVYSAEGNIIYQSDRDYTVKFHGRGNATWQCEKKPYRIVFPDEVDLLDTGASRKWNLLANAYDETQMRNKLAYDFAGQTNMPWEASSGYIDLYVDDIYQGMYQLTEAIEVLETRLNIPEDDILFLTNYENHWDADSIGFYTDGGKCIQLEDSFAPTEEKADLLKEKLNALEEAIARQDASLEDMIDLDSWVDMYLLYEIFLNGEMELNSTYFWWDIAGDGRIHAGPVWDFDLSLGNDNSVWTTVYSDPEKLLYVDEYYSWFPGLLEMDSFREKVISRYESKMRPMLTQLVETGMTELEDSIRSARAMDDIRWEGKLNKVSEDSAAATERMREFLETRIRFLDAYWLGEESGGSAQGDSSAQAGGSVQGDSSTQAGSSVQGDSSTQVGGSVQGDSSTRAGSSVQGDSSTRAGSSVQGDSSTQDGNSLQAGQKDADQDGAGQDDVAQNDSEASAGNGYLKLARIVLRKYGVILGSLGLFGLAGIILVLLDWKRGKKTGK